MKQTFVLHFHEWQDEYLSWNPDDYGGVTDIRLSSNDNFDLRIWKPDVLLYNRYLQLKTL